jgi:Mitochondrial carrier protein.
MTGHGLSSSFVETVAGFTAGIATTLSLHPLDLVKTRLQGAATPLPPLSNHDANPLIFQWIEPLPLELEIHCASLIESSKRKAAWLLFYRGLAPNLIGNSTSWALYFLCYSSLKDAICAYREREGWMLTSSDYFLASGTAG